MAVLHKARMLEGTHIASTTELKVAAGAEGAFAMDVLLPDSIFSYGQMVLVLKKPSDLAASVPASERTEIDWRQISGAHGQFLD